MATQTFSSLRIYKNLTVNENANTSLDGVRLIPSTISTRADDITGYVLKASNKEGKLIWAPGTTQTYSLSDLINTSIPLNVPDNSVLTFNALSGNWTSTPKLTNIGQLVDVDMAGIAEGSILVYSLSASEFQVGSMPVQLTTGGQEGSLQFRNSTGDLDGNNSILWDDTTKELTLDPSSKIIIGGLVMEDSDITGLSATPSSDTSAVSKAYLQTEMSNVATGLVWKEMVEYTTTPADTFSGSQMTTLTSTGAPLTVDTISTFILGNRILFKNNSSAATTNGIYSITSAAHPNYVITRTADMSFGSLATGSVMWVDFGAANKGYAFLCNSAPGSDTVGTHQLTFVEFNANSSDVITAGQGLERVSNTYNLKFNTSTFNVINDNKLDITDTGVIAGSYGSTLNIPVISTNSKGQLTSISETPISFASTSTAGLLSASDFNSFSDRLNATTLADGFFWVGANGTGASQKQITGDVIVSSDGSSLLKVVAGLPIVPFPSTFTATSIKIPRVGVNDKGIVTSMTEVSLPIASGTNNGVLSSADWTTFNSKLTVVLSPGQVFVGSGSGTAISKTLAGDATIDDNGVLTLVNKIVAETKGNSTNIPVITYDSKGRITAMTTSGIPSATSTTKGLLTAADHIAFTNKMPNVLADGNVFIGSASNVATPQTVTGDVTMSKLGVTTLKTVHTTVPVIDYASNLVIPRVQTNAKGLVTSIAAQIIPTVTSLIPGILTSADYTLFKNKLNTSTFIENAKILVGDGSIAKSVSVSGDVTLDNTGRISILPTITGNKTLPGDVNFTSANGDTSTGHTNTNIKIGGSLGVTGKSYFNGPITANALTSSAVSVGSSSFTNGRITNIADPQTDTDAVNKKYVDDSSLGIKWLEPVSLATTVNIVTLASLDPFSNGGKIDNVQLFDNDQRILVKNQDNAKDNGVYIIKTGNWTRATDMSLTTNIKNYSMFVKSGDTNGSSAYVATGTSLVVETDSLTFTLFSKSTSVSAGTGLTGITKLSVKTDGTTITLDPTTGTVRMKEVGSISGSYGTSLLVPSMSTDKYGRVINIANTPIQYASYTSPTTKKAGIISGDDYDAFTKKINTSILNVNGQILVSNGTGPVAVSVSGDATLSNTGQLTLSGIHNPVPVAVNTGITVPDIVIDAQGRVTGLELSTLDYSSASTPGILSATDYNVFAGKMDASELTVDSNIIIGNGVARGSFPLSGDIAMTNGGVVTVASVLTGNKTLSGVITVNELVVTEVDGITAPKVTSDDLIFQNSLSSATGTVTLGSTIITDGRIQGIQPPLAGTDVANRDYVDQSATGIKWQDPVETRAGVNVSVIEVYHVTNNPDGPTLSTGLSSSAVGGHILSLNERVLIDSQNTLKKDQGIYYVTSITAGSGSDIQLKRALDFPHGISVIGFATYVQSGTFGGLSYVVSTTPSTVNTDTIGFSTFAGSSSFTAGVGTSKVINSLNVNYDDVTIGVNDNKLYLKNNSVTAAKLVDGTVSGLKIANDSITTVNILNGSVTNAKLAPGTITNEVISSAAAINPSKLSVSSWTLDSTSDVTLTGTSVANKVSLGETAKFLINASKVVKTSTTQTIGGAKTFSDNTKITSETELIRGTNTSALTVSGGAVVKKNFEAKNVYTENAYISTSSTIGGINVNVVAGSISGVTNVNSVNTTLSGSLAVGGTTLSNNQLVGCTLVSSLVAPTLDDHAANKEYVDSSVSQFAIKRSSVKCMTSGVLGHPPSGSYSTTLTNGVTLVTGDRVLVKDQGNTIENGIYVVDTLSTWTRATDYPADSRADGLTVYVENAKKYMICTNIDAIVNSAVLVFEPLITTGNGIIATGNSLAVSVKDSSLVFDSGQLKVGVVPLASLASSSIAVSGSGINVTNATDSIITSASLGGSLKVAIKLQTDSGLEVTADGIKVLPVSNTRLENSAVTLSTTLNKGVVFKNTTGNEVSTMALGDTVVPEIKLQTNSGLVVTNAGLKVSLPADFVTDANVATGISGSKISAASIANGSLINGTTEINVKTGSGIEVSNDDGATYEANGTLTVDLGSELNLKVSNNVTRNDSSSPFTVPKSFTDTTASTSKTTGAIIVTGGVGVSGDVHALSLTAGSGIVGGITFSGGKVSGITSTVNATDAASKNYVDSLTFGLRWTIPVKYATTSAIGIVSNDLTGAGATLTVDGNSSWIVGDRILVQNELDTTNGIYTVVAESTGSVILARASDMSVTTGATGITLFVSTGSANAGVGFTCTEESPVKFVQFTSGDATDAGDGLNKAGNTVNVVAADATIVSDGSGIKVVSVPLDLLEFSTHTVVPGSGLSVEFREADNITTRSDAILGGYTHLNLGSNVAKTDTQNVFSPVTDSTTITTGAVVISGGLGVAKNVTALSLTGTTLTDGIASISGGALLGVTTANFGDNLTLSKGSAQSITSAQNLSIISTSGTVTVEGVTFNGTAVSNVSSLDLSGNLSVGGLTLNSTGLTGVTSIEVTSDPTTNNQLARKSYVDTKVTVIHNAKSSKDSAAFATSAHITDNIFSGTSNAQGIDIGTGTLTIGQRVLVKNQNTISLNGIYVVGSGTWTRATDFNPGKIGDTVTVIYGSSNKHKTFMCNNITNGYTFELVNGPGLGITSGNAVDFDDVSINLSGTNKLQIKSVAPSLITDRSVRYTYGNGIKSTGDPMLAASAPYPTLSVDYDDVTITAVAGKLKVKSIPNSLLEVNTVTLKNTNSLSFVDENALPITSVALGSTLSVSVKLAPSSGLKVSTNGLEIDSTVITSKLSAITNSQIVSLDSSKLTGTVSNSRLAQNSISVNVGPGLYAKDSLNNNITTVPLGGSVFLTADILDVNKTHTFSKGIVFSDNTVTTTKSSGAVRITNGGLGVFGKIAAGGQIESEIGFKAGSVLIANGLVSGLSNPLNSADAATKSYVDNAVNGSKWKIPVRCATNAPIPASDFTSLAGPTGITYNAAPHTYDGVVIALNDRVLVKNQVNTVDNGIYRVSTYSSSANSYTAKFTRVADLSDGLFAAGAAVFVSEGLVNAKSGFICNNEYTTSVVGTHAMTWAQISGSATYSGNKGIALTGSEFNLSTNENQFSYSGSVLNIKTSGVGTLELADSSVVTAKIPDAGVTNAKLANSTFLVQAGTGLKVKKNSELSYADSVTSALGDIVSFKVDDNVVLKDSASRTIVGVTTLSDTTASISKTSGSLIVAGGVGVSGNLFANNITTATVTGSTLTDGTAIIASGALAGVTTANFSDNITLSKGTAQTITSAQNLSIVSTSGSVAVEGVTFNGTAVSGISTANFSDDIALSKGTAQTVTSAQNLSIVSTGGSVAVEGVTFDGSVVTGVNSVAIENSITLGTAAGTKAVISVQNGGGDSSLDFKIPSSHGSTGSMLSNNGSGTLKWVSNNVLYSRTVIDHTNYGNGINAYNVNTNDDIIAVNYTNTSQAQNGPVNVNLPLISVVGKLTVRIVDEGGKAAVNNISIYPSGSDTIVGKTTPLILAGNYNSYVLYNNGESGWFIV